MSTPTLAAPRVSQPGRPRPVTPMGLVAEQLAEVLALLDANGPGVVLDAAVRAGVEGAYRLAVGLDPYLERCCGEESDALRELAAATRRTDWNQHPGGSGSAALEQEMLSGHAEGRLLQMLVHATRARHVLEIGMFTGYSALAMAEALPEDGTLLACEIDATAAALAQVHFDRSPVGARISVALGPAEHTLRSLAEAGRSFDLVFIDADKAGYLDYLQLLLDRDLLAPDGLVCVDNTLMQGEPWSDATPSVNGAAISAFNRAVAEDPRLDQVVIPLRDGITLIRRHGG